MFTFKLENEDGTPAEPTTLDAAVPNWSPGDPIQLGQRTLRVVEVRPVSGPLDDPVLVVRAEAT
jgi:hypothetical protein